MASPLYPLLEKIVDDAWIKLDREKITPWIFIKSGPVFQVVDYYGRTIAYQGILFEGSPQHVFWGRYIEPFLEDQVDKVISETIRLALEKKQDPRTCLPEAAGLLKSLARRAFARMADVDCRLRGQASPQSVLPRSTDGEIAAVDEFIERRLAAELTMTQHRMKVNDFYNEHPFLFWLLALLVGVAVAFAAG